MMIRSFIRMENVPAAVNGERRQTQPDLRRLVNRANSNVKKARGEKMTILQYDFDQDELYFPVTLKPEHVELLKSFPRTLNADREDVQALVTLGFAIPVNHERFTSFQRTVAGTEYLKRTGQSGQG